MTMITGLLISTISGERQNLAYSPTGKSDNEVGTLQMTDSGVFP